MRFSRLALLIAIAFLLHPAQAQMQPALEERDGRWFAPGSDTPYTGPVTDPGRMQGQYTDGRRDGLWVWTYPDGQREYQMVYEAGRRVRAQGWHPNGRLERTQSYQDDRLHGTVQSWDRHGTLREEASYAAGQRHGTYLLWDHDGQRLYTAEYQRGTLHGAAVWWYDDVRKRWETHYAEGRRTGTWSQWDPDGSLRMQSTWADGVLVSRHNPHAGH